MENSSFSGELFFLLVHFIKIVLSHVQRTFSAFFLISTILMKSFLGEIPSRPGRGYLPIASDKSNQQLYLTSNGLVLGCCNDTLSLQMFVGCNHITGTRNERGNAVKHQHCSNNNNHNAVKA